MTHYRARERHHPVRTFERRNEREIRFSILRFNQFTVMRENQRTIRVTHFQRQTCSIVELRQGIRREPVPQRVVRPLRNAGAVSRSGEIPNVIVRHDRSAELRERA